MQTLSLVWGVLALVGMVVFSIPCLRLLNWVNVPFAALGLGISIVTLATSKAARKGPAVVGLACCGLAILVGLYWLV
jgi:hypothetical protein